MSEGVFVLDKILVEWIEDGIVVDSAYGEVSRIVADAKLTHEAMVECAELVAWHASYAREHYEAQPLPRW